MPDPTREEMIAAVRGAIYDLQEQMDEDGAGYVAARKHLDALDAALRDLEAGGWRPIETAPKDFTSVLAHAVGADHRAMIAIVSWGCARHSFSSKHLCSRHPSADCEFEWLGAMAARYGVPFTHWMPLPEPPHD